MRLHIHFAEVDEAGRQLWVKLRYLSEFFDGNFVMSLLVRIDSRLQMLRGFGRRPLHCQP